MWTQKPCFRFEIDNLSKKKAAIKSGVFVSGGCEWYLNVNLKGCDDQLPLYLCVANPKSLGRGWERSAKFYFLVLNQSDQELYKSPIGENRSVFCGKNTSWGFSKTLPLGKFQEKGFIDKDRLIIEVYIKVFKAFDGVGSETNKTMAINDIQVAASQVTPVRKIFSQPPDLSEDFKPKKQDSEYGKSLKSRLNAYLLRKMADANGSEFQQLEERVEDVSLERKKTVEAFDGVGGGDVSETNKTMDINDIQGVASQGSLMDLVKSQINADGVEDVSLERKKKDDADGSRVQQLEERVKNLEDVHLEMKKSEDDDRSRIQQLEECVKNLKMMVSDLKVELDKEKAKSCADDGFLLV